MSCFTVKIDIIYNISKQDQHEYIYIQNNRAQHLVSLCEFVTNFWVYSLSFAISFLPLLQLVKHISCVLQVFSLMLKHYCFLITIYTHSSTYTHGNIFQYQIIDNCIQHVYLLQVRTFAVMEIQSKNLFSQLQDV